MMNLIAPHHPPTGFDGGCRQQESNPSPGRRRAIFYKEERRENGLVCRLWRIESPGSFLSYLNPGQIYARNLFWRASRSAGCRLRALRGGGTGDASAPHTPLYT